MHPQVVRLRNPLVPPRIADIGKISGGLSANVIADQCSLEWEVRPINKEDGEFISNNIDAYAKDILIPKIKKNNPKGDIKKEVVGEVVGFNKKESSEMNNAYKDNDPEFKETIHPPQGAIVQMFKPLDRPGNLGGKTYKLKWPGSDHAIYITINYVVDDTG